MVAAAPGAVLRVNALETYRSRHRIIGSANSNLADFVDVFRLLAEHSIVPVVANSFGLDDAATAMEAVTDRNRIGKVVIEMGAGR